MSRRYGRGGRMEGKAFGYERSRVEIESDISRQNALIIKLVNSLRDENADTERAQMMIRQVILPEKLRSFPFRICSRHFDPTCSDPSFPVAPTINLPVKPFYSREELLLRLRRRYVYLSEVGYEDVDIDKLEPNGVLISSSGDPIICCVPGCSYKSSGISLFSGRHIKMYSIPSNSVEFEKWRKAIQSGIGLPGTFEFRLPANGHICEMHFAEGKRYTRGLMQVA
ncbi:unnamed protein product [Strongylus vulgaris]|uniref:THAP-type domain-containing protein n=1 Tax=Strongylus vulgaris TaxID=40348 RepID=A0A3P7IM58_STRVU|nr:unnamed protein product [Strongylus vulgaris]